MKIRLAILFILVVIYSIFAVSGSKSSDDTYAISKYGQQVQAAGIPLLKEVNNPEYAQKYPFYLDSVDYLEKQVKPEELAKYQFVYTTADEVEIRYDLKPLFRVRNISAKFSRFVINDFKIQLRKYKSFREYLSVVHKIFYQPPAAPVKPSNLKQKLPSTGQPKKAASLFDLLTIPKAHATGQRESVIGMILVTAVIGYAELKTDHVKGYGSSCTLKSQKLEKEFEEAVVSCLQSSSFNKESLDEYSSYVLQQLINSYVDGAEAFNQKVIATLGADKVNKVVEIFDKRPEFYIKFKFKNMSDIRSDHGCSEQLVHGFDHLQVPHGTEGAEAIASAINSTLKQGQYGSYATFWTAFSKKFTTVKPCLVSYIGNETLPSPVTEEPKSQEVPVNRALTDGNPPDNIVPKRINLSDENDVEVIEYKVGGDDSGKGTEESKSPGGMNPRPGMRQPVSQPAANENKGGPGSGSLADELQQAVPSEEPETAPQTGARPAKGARLGAPTGQQPSQAVPSQQPGSRPGGADIQAPIPPPTQTAPPAAAPTPPASKPPADADPLGAGYRDPLAPPEDSGRTPDALQGIPDPNQ